MSVSDTLRAAVAEKNLADIRGSLWSCLAVDMNMTGKFKESLDYVLSMGISESELFEADKDVGAYSTEPSEENFSELGGLLRINFSKEKIEALSKVGCALYPPVEKKPKATSSTVHQTAQKAGNNAPSLKGTASGKQTKQQDDAVRYAAGGAVVGAGVGAVAAAKLGAKIGGILGFGILGFGIFGAIIGAGIGYALAKNSGK